MPPRDSDNREGKPLRKSKRPSYLAGPGGSRPLGPEETRPADEKPAKEEVRPEALEDHELLSWSVWLLPRRPLVSAAVVSVLALSIYLAYWAFPQFLFVALITGILLNRLAPYLFPVKYYLTEQKAGYKTFLASDMRPWHKLFTYHKFKDGVLLANDTRTVRGRFREGLFLYYGKDTPTEDLLAIIGSKLPTPEEAIKPKDDGEYKGGMGSALRRVRKFRGK